MMPSLHAELAEKCMQLESQLSASEEARQKAEAEALNWRNSYGNASTASLHWRERAEAAEARIKASQEQEPFNGEEWELLAMELAREEHDDIHHLIYEGYPPEPWGEIWQRYEDDAKRIIELYRKHVQPTIPPEVEELQRKLDAAMSMARTTCGELHRQLSELKSNRFKWEAEAAKMQRENAELKRKLAGNEVILLGSISQLGEMSGKSEEEILDECRKNYPAACTKLLEEAKRQVVQEDNLYNQAYRNHVARMSPDLDLEADRIASKVILSAAPQPHKD